MITDRCAFDWTANNRIERLKQWCTEALSASQIADLFWREDHAIVSRNAVIAKTHRIGIRLNGSTGNRVAAAQRKPRGNNGGGLMTRLRARQAVIAPPEMEVVPVIPTEKPPSELGTFAELDMGLDCRFPFGDPGTKGFGYCRAPRAYPYHETYCYCAHHHRIAYRKPPPR